MARSLRTKPMSESVPESITRSTCWYATLTPCSRCELPSTSTIRPSPTACNYCKVVAAKAFAAVCSRQAVRRLATARASTPWQTDLYSQAPQGTFLQIDTTVPGLDDIAHDSQPQTVPRYLLVQPGAAAKHRLAA